MAVFVDAWRTAPFVALLLLAGLATLLLLGVLNALTEGGFYFHTITANANEFRWELVTGNLSFMGSFMPLLLVGGLAFVVLGLRARPAGWWFVGAYLGAAVATAFLIGKIGSDVNYLLELSAALALAAGSLVGRYLSRPGVRAALLLALAVQVAVMVQASQFTYARFQAGVIVNRDGLARLEEVVDDAHGPVLADEYAGLLPSKVAASTFSPSR